MTIEEWAEDFKSYVNELNLPNDDYKGIMEYIADGCALLKEQEPMSPEEFKNGLLNMFSSIWDSEIDHPVFQDTVGDLMSGVIQLYKEAVKLE